MPTRASMGGGCQERADSGEARETLQRFQREEGGRREKDAHEARSNKKMKNDDPQGPMMEDRDEAP